MTPYTTNHCLSIRKSITFLLSIFSLFFSSYSFAAQMDSSSKLREKAPPFYFGLSTGLNNQIGLLGVNLEIPIANQFSISTGLGFGTWGTKYYGQAFLYFDKNSHRGSAISFGITRAIGPKEKAVNVATTSGTGDVTITGTGASNGFLSYYHFFNMGKSKSKFYFQLGYSFKLNHPTYTLYTGNYYSGHSQPSESGYKYLNSLAPGGIIVGLGLYIAVH